MKSKKKIMLVLSVLMMTLSLSLSNMSVLAAEKYNYVSFGSNSYRQDYQPICQINLKEGGMAVNVGGTVYYYEDSENYQIEVKANMLIDFTQLTNDGSNSVYFSDKTTGFVWDMYGQIKWDWMEASTNEPVFKCNMALMDLEANIYGKSYDLTFQSNVGLNNPDLAGMADISRLVYVDDIPETKRLSSNDVEIEATFLLSFNLSGFDNDDNFTLTPRCCYIMGNLNFYELYDETLTCLYSILDSLKYTETLDEARQRRLLDMYNLLDDMYAEQVNNRKAIKDLQNEIVLLLKEQGSDSDVTDGFASNSDSQSDKLNGLNEQNKMDKIDVDSASSSVDSNIDGNAITNYGVVLSSITGQGKVVQLMLIVLSVGLVSYVLFGKR